MTDDVPKIDNRPYLISALRRRRNRGRAPAGPTPSGSPSNSGRGLLMFVPASCQGRSRSLQALDLGARYQDLGVYSVSEMPPPRVSQVLARRLPRLLLTPDCIEAARPPGYKEDVHRTRGFRRTEIRRPEAMQVYTFEGRTYPTKLSFSVIRCACGVTKSRGRSASGKGRVRVTGSPCARRRPSIWSAPLPTALSHTPTRPEPSL